MGNMSKIICYFENMQILLLDFMAVFKDYYTAPHNAADSFVELNGPYHCSTDNEFCASDSYLSYRLAIVCYRNRNLE